MLRRWMRVFFVVIGIGGITIALTMGRIPYINGISTIGGYLGRESSLCLKDGQGKERMLAELLGGKEYVIVDGNRKQTEELILKENHGIYEEAEENKQPLVGDVESALNGSILKKKQPVVRKKNVLVEQLKESLDEKFLWKNFYIVDSTTSVTKENFNVKQLLEADMKMRKKAGKKQILIYHTHGASEYFKDSRKGKIEDSIVSIGDVLTQELEKMGYGVYHDRTQYDLVNGAIDRSFAYNQSLEGIAKRKKQYPDIEVMIDLHRDSVGKGKHTYTMIDEKKTAVVMFFNGLSRTKNGAISYLHNPNLKENLAFSLQMKCKAMEYYDGFTKPIYLKGYRYNLHFLQKSLLIELGNENNTLEEAKNAAKPLADVLDKVLSGKD